MEKQTVLVMTGDKLRHQYFAAKILENVESSILLVEKQPKEPWGCHINEPTSLIQKHFMDFYETEQRLLSPYVRTSADLLEERAFLSIDDGEINNTVIIEKIKEIKPILLLVHSTSLLSDHFIRSFSNKSIVNLHAGLSPYYRGTGTNVFPFYNNELEYIGMTVHYMDVGIDSGDIIVQGRPTFEGGDNTHTIGCKNVMLGADLMIKLAKSYLEEGSPQGFKQDLSIGHIYYKKDFTDQVLLKIQENLRVGVVEDYVAKQPVIVDIMEDISYRESNGYVPLCARWRENDGYDCTIVS